MVFLGYWQGFGVFSFSRVWENFPNIYRVFYSKTPAFRKIFPTIIKRGEMSYSYLFILSITKNRYFVGKSTSLAKIRRKGLILCVRSLNPDLTEKYYQWTKRKLRGNTVNIKGKTLYQLTDKELDSIVIPLRSKHISLTSVLRRVLIIALTYLLLFPALVLEALGYLISTHLSFRRNILIFFSRFVPITIND